MHFEKDVDYSTRVLEMGGLILYPTDTVWGIGCDACNAEAVSKIYQLKQRPESKSLIVLLADPTALLHYVAAPDPEIFDYIETLEQPTTIIYPNAIGLAENLLSDDHSVAIRIVKDEFCRHLLKRFRKPIVSTSANISGEPAPQFYNEVSPVIRDGVDYIVKHRQEDHEPRRPSTVVKWEGQGRVTVIRE